MLRPGRGVARLTALLSLAACGASASAVSPMHVQNWLYACSEGQTCTQALNVGISARWMAAHASWSEVYYSAAADVTARQLAAASAAHVVIYTDPNISPYCPVPRGDHLDTSDVPENSENCTGAVAGFLRAENGSYAHAYQHQQNGDRLVDHADGLYGGQAQEPFYIGDPDLQSAFRLVTAQNPYATDVFEDDAGGAYNCIVDDNGDCSSAYGAAHSAPPLCDYTGGYWCYKYGETAREWDDEANPQQSYAIDAIDLSNASRLPVIGNNGIGTDTYDLEWLRAANVEGALWEGAWQPSAGGVAWAAKADAVLVYHSLNKYVVELSKDSNALMFQIASHWIVYDPTYSIEALAEVNPATTAAGRNDTTFPEELIVPTLPRVATPSNNTVTTFEVASGVFVREYSACYQDGASIGYCAAIVNTNGSTASISGLTERYGHVLVHNTGATWAAGGTPIWSATVPATIGAEAGVILAQ